LFRVSWNLLGFLASADALQEIAVNPKSRLATFTLIISLCSPSLAAAADTPAPHASPAQVYGQLLKSQEGELVSLAEAMPADKYNFAPTSGSFEGVRTFAQQITHIAAAQYAFFGGFGIKPGVDRSAIGKLTSKDDIVKALKDSYAFAESAVETMTEQNAFEKIAEVDGTDTRASIAAFGLAHSNDHYGQMVVYLRMNGIIPPSSRK
jgi:uncharacterized damage-inducible protein DinB